MDYLRDSFSVHSPNTEQYRNSYDRIFICGATGAKKSACNCESCVAERQVANTKTNEVNNGDE